MEFTLLLQDRLGVRLSENHGSAIETIRDLMRRLVEHRPRIPGKELGIATDIERWLAPRGIFLRLLAAGIYALNRLVMRGLFRLRATGDEQLPISGPFVITPNHVSYLDAPAIAAALSFRRFPVPLAGDTAFFSNPLVGFRPSCASPGR
jgi:long-chain acyl-CoA synthetase